MIVSPWGACVISLHHQLLTASAQLRHRSRMQCNAGACKTAQLHFRIQVVPRSASAREALQVRRRDAEDQSNAKLEGVAAGVIGSLLAIPFGASMGHSWWHAMIPDRSRPQIDGGQNRKTTARHAPRGTQRQMRRDRLRTRPHRCFVSLYRVRRSEAQFVDRGRHKTLLRLGIVPALDGNASAMPLHAGVSKQVDRVSGIVTHTP